jgi:hypothetical protein
VLGATASPDGHAQAGTAYVLFGQLSGWPARFNLTTLTGSNGFAVDGLNTGDYLGISVSTAGDVNGDGITDLVLGALGVNNGQGAAYVIFGNTAFVSVPNLSPPPSFTPVPAPATIPGNNPSFVSVPVPAIIVPQSIPIPIQVSHLPVVTHPIPDQTLEVNNPFNFTFAANTFTDPDGDVLTYAAHQTDGNSLPSWLAFDKQNRFFSGVTPSLAGTNQLSVQATDSSNLSATANFSLFVAPL